MILTPGAVVGGDFRVQRPLSSGGMGAVYVVEQISTGQLRALKVMHPDLVNDARLCERFVQEARVGGRIPSHHVVQVIAAGIDAQLGMPWLAMELLSGEDLQAHIARCGPLAFSDLLRIYRELCHALGAAHSVGIVHRDIKPENVFLAKVPSADASEHVKVLDFGIAKILADARLSATAQVGTPLWMAPEQGDPGQPVVPAADVWALGLLAFRLLTGKYYWRTANSPEAGLSALFRESLFEPLVPASVRASEYGVLQTLPAGFDAWFARTVVREPEQRFSDATQAFAALNALAGQAASEHPATLARQSANAPPGTGGAGWQTPSGAVSAPPSVTAPALHGTAVPKRSRAPVLVAVGGAMFLLGVVALVLVVVGVFVLQNGGFALGGATSTPAAPAVTETAAPSPLATDTPTAAAPPGSSAPGSRPAKTGTLGRTAGPVSSAQAGPPKESGAAPAPGASSGEKKSELKPIDRPGVERRIAETARAASVECALRKQPDAGVETFSGSRGFRPDGSNTMFFQGLGGSRECARDKMSNLRIGPYAHPDVGHVEVFPFTITVK